VSAKGGRGAGFVVAAAVLWASIGPASRFSLDGGLDPLELAFWRGILGGVFFGAHAAARGRFRIARQDVPAVVAFALVGVTLFYAAFFEAVRTGGAALAAVLLYTAPVWVIFASALWLNERVTVRKLVAVAVILAGVALVALSSGAGVRFSGAAFVWGLLSGVAYATYYLFGKRYFGPYDASTIFLYAMPVGALALIPWIDWSAKSTTDVWVILYLSAVPTYAAYLLYSIGIQRIEAGRAATVAAIEPVVAAALAWLFWREVLGWWGYAGAVLVIAGVVIAARGREGEECVSAGNHSHESSSL
jgi:drug/metabolite transporter, DME family